MGELLRQLLNGQNQFASGGLLLMIVGSIGVFLRSLPWRLWGWIEEQTTMTITVQDEDAAFRWVKEWFWSSLLSGACVASIWIRLYVALN